MDSSSFIQKIISLAVKHDISITSWIRSKARNRQVGGVPDSLHLVALAVDVVCDNKADNAAVIRDAKRLGLLAIESDNYIHIQIPHPQGANK